MKLLIKNNLIIFTGFHKLVICFLYKGPEGVIFMINKFLVPKLLHILIFNYS